MMRQEPLKPEHSLQAPPPAPHNKELRIIYLMRSSALSRDRDGSAPKRPRERRPADWLLPLRNPGSVPAGRLEGRARRLDPHHQRRAGLRDCKPHPPRAGRHGAGRRGAPDAGCQRPPRERKLRRPLCAVGDYAQLTRDSSEWRAFDGKTLHIISATMVLLGGHGGGPLSWRPCHGTSERV